MTLRKNRQIVIIGIKHGFPCINVCQVPREMLKTEAEGRIIGIKHGFLCINVCQVPREMLKTEAEGRGFQQLPRDLANVNALENLV